MMRKRGKRWLAAVAGEAVPKWNLSLAAQALTQNESMS
jgi:hypothetical protein